jgi:hypothetical protein
VKEDEAMKLLDSVEACKKRYPKVLIGDVIDGYCNGSFDVSGTGRQIRVEQVSEELLVGRYTDNEKLVTYQPDFNDWGWQLIEDNVLWKAPEHRTVDDITIYNLRHLVYELRSTLETLDREAELAPLYQSKVTDALDACEWGEAEGFVVDLP